MLLSLNEHCLLRICEFLNLEDQVQLSQVNEFFHDLFVNNVWKWKCKKICLTNEFWYEKENETCFSMLIRVAANCVEQIKLNDKAMKKYGEALNGLKFPKLKKCVSVSIEEDQMFKITQIFPEIKALYLEGFVYESVLTHFPLLTELEEIQFKPDENMISLLGFIRIYGLPNLKKISFSTEHGGSWEFYDAIKQVHNCLTLEEIGFNEDVMEYNTMKSLKKIKNLHTLKIWTDSQVLPNLYKIEKHFGEAIDTLVLHRMSCKIETLQLESLRCLIFYKTDIKVQEFSTLCINLPKNLEEFYYLHSLNNRPEENTTNMLRLINKINNLSFLDISGTAISDDLIKNIVQSNVLRHRKQTLIIRCFQTSISKKSLEDQILPENLRLLFSKADYNFEMSNSVNCQVKLDRSKIKQNEYEEEEEYESDYYYEGHEIPEFWGSLSG